MITGWETCGYEGFWGGQVRENFVTGDARSIGVVLGFIQSIYIQVLLKSVGSIGVDRDSLLPFNPTYVLSDVNTP